MICTFLHLLRNVFWSFGEGNFCKNGLDTGFGPGANFSKFAPFLHLLPIKIRQKTSNYIKFKNQEIQ